MRVRLNVYFPPALAKQIDELAIRRRISRSAIVEAAVSSYLSPDGADRMEAAFARRLDRMSRQVQRLERNTGLSAEALALFGRFWLSLCERQELARRNPRRFLAEVADRFGVNARTRGARPCG